MERHFSKFWAARESPKFDKDHFNYVNEQIEVWASDNDNNVFTENPFTKEEIMKGIKKLKLNKSPGYDEITAENIRYGGESLVNILIVIFKAILETEYILISFRRSIQIPMYKG